MHLRLSFFWFALKILPSLQFSHSVLPNLALGWAQGSCNEHTGAHETAGADGMLRMSLLCEAERKEGQEESTECLRRELQEERGKLTGREEEASEDDTATGASSLERTEQVSRSQLHTLRLSLLDHAPVLR